jgi:hypothetical protein
MAAGNSTYLLEGERIMDTTHLIKRMTKAPHLFLTAALLLGLSLSALPRQAARAATPGLPFTEDFADTDLRDGSLTNANWSTEEQALVLAWRRVRYGAFGPGLVGSEVSPDAHDTLSVALGDVDGDGDLDLLAGNGGEANQLYLNDGTADPFAGVVGSDVSADADDTSAVALGDVDGDGDLDLLAGNIGNNRLYLNNGTADPFAGVTGSTVAADAPHHTRAAVLEDVDGDGDLDLLTGDDGEANRLYLNNGTADPFAGVVGTDVTDDAHKTQSVVLGDVDGDGDLDLVAGNYGQANRLYLNNGTAMPFGGVTGSSITTDAHLTQAVALGDVDGDGDLDLIDGNYGVNRLYLNNGTASPFGGVTGSSITTDAHFTHAVALGDVDGDGDLDLVAGNSDPGSTEPNRLYLNNGTPAPFSGVTGSDVGTDTDATESVALGDLDRDGDLDLVVGNYSQPNQLYLNEGTADPFNGVTGSDVTTDTHGTLSVALGDLDRDGDLDLVTSDKGTNRLYLNNGTAAPFSGVTGSDVSTDTLGVRSVAALGDADGDGDLDLLAGYSGQINRLYLNNGTADPFSGVSGSDISTDADDTWSVALGDVDGDGHLDLVTGNDGQANRLYLNNGTTDPFSSVSGSDVTTDIHSTFSVALGDVDGDGDLDLVAGNNYQANRLYLNNGTGAPFSGVTGSDVSGDAHATQSVALGDVDGDGDLDLVAGNYNQANRLYLNDGTNDPFSGVISSDISGDTHDTESLALGDVDGDGDLDLVAGNDGQVNRLYLNDGTAAPFSGVSGSDVSGDAHDTKSLALGDVDGDGHMDLVAGNWGQVNRLYLNAGGPSPTTGWTGSDATANSGWTRSVALGDVDGDGDLDLVAANWHQPNRLYLNNGTQTPFSGVTGTDVTTDTHGTWTVALGDMDGDGDLDLAAGNMGRSRLYLNNGTTTPFDGVPGADIGIVHRNTRSLVLGDVDGDGDLDVVTGNYDGTNRLYLNNGTSDPFNGVTGSDVSLDAYLYTNSVALGDVDGDGDLDLVAGNCWGQTSSRLYNRLYLNNGTADPFSGVTGKNVSTDAHYTYSVALGDMDRDGDLDLVAGNHNQVNRLYLNNGTADPFDGVTGSNASADARSTFSMALGDVDGDGDLDLMEGNYDQPNRLYLNDGTATPFSGATPSDVTADTHSTESVALGDVDGDGDLDLVAGNRDQANRLYRRVLYHTAQGQARSLRVDAETENIDQATLIPTASLPPNTRVTYWLSNNGGARWFIVRPGVMFVFPTTGTDLRWRAELHSLSPVRTPRVDQIVITARYYVYLPLVLR